jgi:hypothetical protein
LSARAQVLPAVVQACLPHGGCTTDYVGCEGLASDSLESWTFSKCIPSVLEPRGFVPGSVNLGHQGVPCLNGRSNPAVQSDRQISALPHRTANTVV